MPFLCENNWHVCVCVCVCVCVSRNLRPKASSREGCGGEVRGEYYKYVPACPLFSRHLTMPAFVKGTESIGTLFSDIMTLVCAPRSTNILCCGQIKYVSLYTYGLLSRRRQGLPLRQDLAAISYTMRYGAYFADIANGDKGTSLTSPW
jgi:hypothetical protein